ncbi:hypothetical protein SmJEL517_g03680 [Synchytrium microbalum]|uniref:NADH:flavin oxidoreductase/NADH oxidase N-terminal domain-containing protein n=1 Tax=Synchytrium microbalum TaxID=1806994 RepID=A0A507C5Z9_9FUNG|nr:uncharacterized protein SmJEL517_g03680 [Synchytrium microbalum]TPX33396.1 hypothetical protein SmJEL517_g03680 [Synchytrium microbalum]
MSSAQIVQTVPLSQKVPLKNVGSALNLTKETPSLFQPISFRNMTLKNRLVVSPMCMYSAEDGMMNVFSLAHQTQFAIRGASLVIFEATGILPNGRITPACAGIWKDEQIVPMMPSIELIHRYGGKAGIQLAHAGRKGSNMSPHFGLPASHDTLSPESEGGWPNNIWGPSAIQGFPTAGIPKEMTKQDIEDCKTAFVDAALRADKAGFDMIEIHAAHGYLIHEFLSPVSNKRTDEYGGSFENRIRFCVEVINAVRAAYPQEKPVWLRISVSDYIEGGWSIQESARLAEIVYPLGIDLIDCSGGGLSPAQKVPYGPAFNLPGAEEIRKVVPSGAIGLTGQITDSKQAQTFLDEKKADLFIIGREFLRNPSLVLTFGYELGVDVQWPTQYERAKKHRA